MSDANPFTIHFPVSILLGMSLVAHILNGDWFAALWCAVAGVLLVLHYQAIFERGLCREILSESLSKAKRGGNNAKMREALEYVLHFDATDEAAMEDGLTDAERIAEYADHIKECQKKANAALAEPARNCDRFNNAVDAMAELKRIHNFCATENRRCLEDCPDCGKEWCSLAWLFATTEESEVVE